MDTLTLKVPDIIKEKLKLISEKKGVSRSEIVRSALIEYFSNDDLDKKGSFLDLSKDLAGSVEGPSDLSTNKEFLKRYGK
ncbi:MAG: ribbon-helix-helix protein, CopG family [Candidatus Marinimicrobia bacterium]|nr:ribbon-helix-helix protein, CopG family [Candidatus Neomarinimicrobiota bacterium]MCH7763027.1 ribbon-helix-helix protein, CopG family [Candidatus Neomarinimicrobiota bacterium]